MVVRSSTTPRRTAVFRIIIGLLVLLVVVGLVSGGVYLYLRFGRSSSSAGMPHGVRRDRIQPSLALLTLAGVEDADVVNLALDAEELETAYATTLFSTELTDGERVGSLALLGHEYLAVGERDRAQLCHQQANVVATLSPSLSDFAKATAFLEIGKGLAGSGNVQEALSNYEQAFVVAFDSPYMRGPHRAEVFGELAAAYQELGEDEKAGECLTLQAKTRYVFDESEEPSEYAPEQPVSPFMMEMPEPTAAMVASYEQKRVETVQQLIDSLEESSGSEAIREDLMTDVTQALLNEDNARLGAYEEQLAGASSMVLKIGIAEARVDWLVVKYRVALNGYGLQLVPAWTDHVADIETELNEAYGELHDIYAEQISTFSDQTAVDQAWFDVLRFEIGRGRLGLYPDYPEEELLSQLAEVTESLVASGDPSLHIDVDYEGDTPVFTLAAAE